MQLAIHQPLPRVRYSFACAGAPDFAGEVRRVSVDEGLSRPYELVVELLAERVDPDSLLGTSCELLIEREGVERALCGVISRVELDDPLADQCPIRLTVVPALRLLEQRVDSRLWQDMSALEVVEEVLRPGLGAYERELDSSRLRERYPTRELIVQYRESDLALVSRLLEDEGVSYHFDHERGSGREVMVLEDSVDHWAEVPTLDDNPTLELIAADEQQSEVESVQRLSWDRAVRPTAVVRRSFDWQTPSKPSSTKASEDQAPGPSREIYDHGRIIEPEPARRVVRELAGVRAGARALRGISNVVGLAPGRRFRIAAPDRPELESDEFLVTRLHSRGDCPEIELGQSSGEQEFVNEFECVALGSEPWRPPRCTPLPRIPGPQTALVTGPEGEEIHTDEHGRIKVRFAWDRLHALTDDSSAWIRVAQGWAGAGFGVLFVPRIGMEVVVEFIEGDPDRPLITGCVHNGESPTSVALPEAKTQSTIRTRSSPGGAGFNELRFEDAAGGEEIFVHAQRDLREQVGHDRSSTIGRHRSETIRGSHRQIVHGRQVQVVDQTRSATIRGEETLINEKSRTTTVYGEELLEVYDHSTGLHHGGLERRITGSDLTHVRAPETGVALSETEVDGKLEFKVRDEARLTAGDRVELIQGSPAARVQAVMADGNLGLDAELQWRGSSGTKAQLQAGSCLELSAVECAELRQGRASIRIQNDTVVIDAREVRIIVDNNHFTITDKGLCCESASVEMLALGAISIKGATVSID
ncbi:MAG: type VI secretion system tip protein TssI/VgrG [Enhygromyxa sp.]